MSLSWDRRKSHCGVRPEKLPDDIRCVQLLAGFPNQELRRLTDPTGPMMPEARHSNQHDLCLLSARSIHAFVDSIRIFVELRFSGGVQCGGPLIDKGLNGRFWLPPLFLSSKSEFRIAAFDGVQRVCGASDVAQGKGICRFRALDPAGASHRSDGSDALLRGRR